MTNEIATRRIYSPPATSYECRNIIEYCLSGATCNADTDFKIALLNMPTSDEIGRLTARHRELMHALKEHDRKDIGAIIAEMLASYDVSKQRYKTQKERMEAVAKYVQELHGVPTWAVSIACNRIRTGSAPDISHVYEPTTIQVRVLAVEIAQPFKTECINIGNILTAQRYNPPVDEAQRKRVGEMMRGLADEMQNRIDSARDDQVRADAPRAKALTNNSIEADYRAHGEEPRRSGDMLISRSLAKMLMHKDA